MKFDFVISAVLVAVVAAIAQPKDSADYHADSVLIVKGKSWFEDTVVKIAVAKLAEEEIGVRVVNIADADYVRGSRYGVAVLVHAIKAFDLSTDYAAFLGRYNNNGTDDETNVIVATLSGDPWQKGKKVVDAIAGATKPYKPEAVALRIVSQIKMKLRP